MYTIQTEASFDSAHFLKDYEGKCSNIHGHRWRVEVELAAHTLKEEGAERGMIMDLTAVKERLRAEADRLDHALIIEEGSLLESTVKALESEHLRLVILPFRPTSENLAKYFFDCMKETGCPVYRVRVFETPGNGASYGERIPEAD